MNTKIIPLKTWSFHLGELPIDDLKNIDLTQFEKVDLPHDWSAKEPLSESYSSGTGYARGGIGWYAAEFPFDESFPDKKVYIHFDGVYKKSEVYLNGIHLGTFPSGYLPFSYDLTPHLDFKGINRILVRADHEDLADSRWYNGSGMTRKACLFVTDFVHVTRYGFSHELSELRSEEAHLKLKTEVRNSKDEAVRVEIIHAIFDEENQEVLKVSDEVEIFADEDMIFIQDVHISSPKLWSLENPHLYTVKTYIKLRNDKEPDLQNETRIGLRTFSFDADTGFQLNRRSMKLKGVCLHEDGGTLGNAMYEEVWKRRLLMLKEAGVNALRMSHNPHMEELYDLADELGFLVIEEAFDEWEGPKNKWHKGHNVYPPKHEGAHEFFEACHEHDLKTMVKRGRNHPSIILWSLGNEVDYPNDPYCHPLFKTMVGNNDLNKPREEMMYNPDKPNAERLVEIAKRLRKIVKEMDTERPVTFASAFPELSSELGLFDAFDVMGYNYKEHLFEKDHGRFPALPFLDSENGHETKKWKIIERSPYLAGQFIWTGIDYLGESRPSWPNHGSHSGLLLTSGERKAEYYHRASLWSDQPVLRLFTAKTGQAEEDFSSFTESYSFSEGEEIEIRCLTNTDPVRISLNGRPLGTFTRNERGYISLVLPFENGVLEAACENRDISISHRLQSPGNAVKLRARVIDQTAGLVQIRIEAIDEKRIPVLSSHEKVQCFVEGGTLLALDNGDLADVTLFSGNTRRLYRGHLVAYIRPSASEGDLTVDFCTENLEGESLCL